MEALQFRHVPEVEWRSRLGPRVSAMTGHHREGTTLVVIEDTTLYEAEDWGMSLRRVGTRFPPV